MTALLKIFSALALVVLALALLTGYLSSALLFDPGSHVAVGLIAALGAILLLTILMSWFMVTGAAVRKRAQEGKSSPEEYQLTKKFKARLFPFTIVAILLLMVVPALGAAYDTGQGPLWHHALVAWTTLCWCIFTHLRLRKTLDENADLFLRMAEEKKAQTDNQ